MSDLIHFSTINPTLVEYTRTVETICREYYTTVFNLKVKYLMSFPELKFSVFKHELDHTAKYLTLFQEEVSRLGWPAVLMGHQINISLIRDEN